MINFLLLTFIVGIITGVIKVKYDRFFILLLIIFLLKKDINAGIEILLWTIFLGSGIILSENKKEIQQMPKPIKKKLFIVIPIISAFFSFVGSYLFSISSDKILFIILSIITLIYALRLIFIHFSPEEMKYSGENNKFQKLCFLISPIISGLSIGYIGTSLKAVKIPFAVKIGKANLKQVYFLNTFIAFSATGFTLIWHNFVFRSGNFDLEYYFENYFLLAAAIWTAIHFIADITSTFVKKSWQKSGQIIVGIGLLFAFSKIVMIILSL